MTTKKPVDDALMFRDVAEGAWFAKYVLARHIEAHRQGGWRVLLSAAEMKDLDIADTYNASLAQFGLRERL